MVDALAIRQHTLALALAVTVLSAPIAEAQVCTGDCNGDERVEIWEIVRGVGIAMNLPDTDSCSAVDRNLDDSVTIDELTLSVNDSLHGCPGQSMAFATAIAADFTTGGFASADIAGRAPLFVADAAHPATTDSVPRAAAGIVLLVNRFGGDSITARDPRNDYAVLWECSTGADSNPQDVVVINANKAYASLYGSSDLLVFDPSPAADCSDFEVDRIDLSSLADKDGIPEMTQMALVDGSLYVALQKLTNFVPSGPGVLAIIDTGLDEVVDSITLQASNPFGATKGLLVRDGALYVSQIGSFGQADAGLERIDLGTGHSDGLILDEQALGGDLNDFAIFSATIAYATVGLADFTNTLVAFDPSNGTVGDTIIPAGASISDIEINDRGELYVADRGAAALRVFDASTGAELAGSGIDTGLPPFEVLFLR